MRTWHGTNAGCMHARARRPAQGRKGCPNPSCELDRLQCCSVPLRGSPASLFPGNANECPLGSGALPFLPSSASRPFLAVSFEQEKVLLNQVRPCSSTPFTGDPPSRPGTFRLVPTTREHKSLPRATKNIQDSRVAACRTCRQTGGRRHHSCPPCVAGQWQGGTAIVRGMC